jgi:plastocyanin
MEEIGMGIERRPLMGFHGRTMSTALAGAGLLVAIAAGTVAAADEDVAISGFSYSPRTVTVTVGDSVTWTNSDAQAHTATADDGSFDTGSIGNGASGSITFSTAGRFAYHCEFHADMAGTVIVQGESVQPPRTDAVAWTASRGEDAWTAGLAPFVVLGLVFGLSLIVGLRRFRGA